MEIRSETSDNLYIVAQNRKTGEWGCNCMGWKRARPGMPRSCKHLRNMLPLLLSAPVNKPVVRSASDEPKGRQR